MTYTDEEVHNDSGRQDRRASAWRDVAKVANDLHALAALGQRHDRWELRLEQRSFFVCLNVDEY